MVEGIHLTLKVGPAVPVPVPRQVLEALESVEVTTSGTGPSGFQLTFQLSPRSPLHTLFLLTGGGAIPLIRVQIIVTVRGTPKVLMDGVMTHHEVQPGGEDGQTTLTVTGEDLTRLMDYIEFDGFPYPAMPPAARVALILAKYAAFGVIPKVIPSVMVDVPIPTERIPRHQGTDLAYVKKLAAEVGYVFYLEPGPQPGTNVGYWGPEFKVGVPQPPLDLDMDAHRNVEDLSFRYDSAGAEMPILYIHEENSKAVIPIPVPPVTPLNPPLGAVPPIPKKFPAISCTAKLSPARAAMVGLARAAKSFDVVKGSGSLDVVRYGRPLEARRLVGVRGAGPAYDGLHYVESVTHQLRRGEYKQSFELVRNGLLSTLPRLPT